MKFIIIGLGNFGFSLAVKLTQMGHEVIGVDEQIKKIEEIKEQITQAICLDCRHPDSVKNLPLKNTDVVVVSIGENEGSNILTTALMKKMKVPRLISRAVSPLHETILEAMGVTEIVRPEEETAERWAKKLSNNSVIDSFELTDKYSIVVAEIPPKYDGKTIRDVGFSPNHHVIVLTIMKNTTERNLLGVFKKVSKLDIQGVASADTLLKKGDLMVLYGHKNNIQRILDVND